jgi:prepilin peptidase CpaA
MSTIISHWPLAFICVAMIGSGFIDGRKLKVPNWFTYPVMLSGWLLGVLHNFSVLTDSTGVGGIGSALAGTFFGMALLYPVYMIGGMGAGDVKMQMGFGSWIGTYYGLASTEQHPGALWIIFWAFSLAVIIGGVIAAVMIVVRGQYRRNLENTRAILGDLVSSSGIEDIANKARERKPRMHLLPYGIPLCIGFVAYLICLHGL